MRVRRITVLLFLAAMALLLSGAAAAQTTTKLNLSVNATAKQHPIDPNIYGMSQYAASSYPTFPSFAEEIKLPNIRWGGNATTRYNWQVDATNSGADFFFIGGNGQSNPTPSGQVDAMISTYKPAGTNPLVTIPIIPYIYSNSYSPNTNLYLCSFNQKYYPNQGVDPFVGWTIFFPFVNTVDGLCGMGWDQTGSYQLLDTNIYYNHIDNGPSIQQQWVQHLVSTFGKSWKGGIHYFQLDNEPYGWGNTHVDVMPNGAPYDLILNLGEQYATGIKQVDPSALVFGPSDFTLGGWLGDPNYTQGIGIQDNLPAAAYYLKEFAKYDEENGKRSLDYFDEHFYGNNGTTNPPTGPGEIQTTRALWDPTYNSGTWVEQYFFNGPMMLIPRFKSWAKKYYPGTKVSLSEFSMTLDGTQNPGGVPTIYDALTQADTLGIFGREGLDFADEWYVPNPTDPVAYAYRIYRNYDGKGGQYGDTWVDSTSQDQTQLVVYGAQRSKDRALTLVVINKTGNPIKGVLHVENFQTTSDWAEIYSYTGSNLTSIVRQPNIPLAKTGNSVKGFTSTFPAYSASTVVIKRTN